MVREADGQPPGRIQPPENRFRDRLTAECFLPLVENEPIGAIELALKATLEAEPIEAKIRAAGAAIRQLGMRFNAGHALNYYNVQPIARLPGIRELHIGHSIISRSVFTGLREAVREMKRLMREGAERGLRP